MDFVSPFSQGETETASVSLQKSHSSALGLGPKSRALNPMLSCPERPPHSSGMSRDTEIPREEVTALTQRRTLQICIWSRETKGLVLRETFARL